MRHHYEALEAMYTNGPINQFFRPAIHVDNGLAEVRMSVRPDMHHAAHAAHGAVYFKMLDDAAFFAVQSLVADVFVLTVSFNLHLLRPVVDGEVVASGTVVHQSKRLFLAESILTNGSGDVIARGTGSFIRSAIRLDGKVGYSTQ